MHLPLRSLLPLLMLSACASPASDWLGMLPQQTLLVQTVLDERNTSIYDQWALLGGADTSSLPDPSGALTQKLRGRALVGHGVDHLNTLWIFEGTIDEILRTDGWESVSKYDNGLGELRVFRHNGQPWTLAEVGGYSLLCQLSVPVEETLRAFHGRAPAMSKPEGAGSAVVHGSALGRIATHLSAPLFDAAVSGGLAGLGSDRPDLSAPDGDGFRATGSMAVANRPSALVRYLASSGNGNDLDRLIPAEASLVVLYEDRVGEAVYDRIRWEGLDPSEADRLAPMAQNLQAAVLPETAFVVLDGSAQETAFIRRVDSEDANAVLSQLYARGYIDGSNELFQSRSAYLARLLGSALCSYTSYYIALGDNFLILSDKASVARRLAGGSALEGSLSEAEEYRSFRGNDHEGALVWANMPNLIASARLSGWLDPEVPIPNLLPTYNWAGLATRYEAQTERMGYRFEVGQVRRKAPSQVALLWQFPLRGDLTGPPLIATLNGRTAITASRADGTLFTFRADGSLMFEVTTGLQKPLGSADNHDWYSNRSPVLFQAAGNSIYAWSPSGTLLPGFPFVLDAPISAPLLFTDADSDGETDIVAATADERLHLINRNGRGHLGWPVYTRAKATIQPEVDRSSGKWSVRVIAGNTQERFDRTGISQGSSSYYRSQDTTAISVSVYDDWDLTGDGTPDRIEISEARGVQVIDGKKGTSVPDFSSLGTLLHASVADVNGDGKPEIVGVYNGQLRCLRLGPP